jgi:signal transduction histidine kinase
VWTRVRQALRAEVSAVTRPEETAAHRAADAGSIRANKLELLERLADDLAHEIKNPLHSMVINLEVLKRRLSRAAPAGGDDVLRYAGVLSEELDRVHRRIELLLRLSRPDRAPEETTLQEVVEELLELIQLEARQHGAHLEFHRGGETDRIRVSRAHLRQIILNLVLHALDRADGDGTLEMAVRGGNGRSELVVCAAPGTGAADGGKPRPSLTGPLAVAAVLAEGVGATISEHIAEDGRTGHTLGLPLVRAAGNKPAART